MLIIPLILLVLILVITSLFYMTSMPGKSYSGKFDSLTPVEAQIKEELHQYVVHLATHIGPRHLLRPEALTATAEYLKDNLRRFGYTPIIQNYTLESINCENIIAEIKGTASPEEVIIIGAHYDSVMLDCPGANDNGSGVAAVLVLSRLFFGRETSKTLRFVFFVNEEPPFFLSRKMGSFHYAKALKRKKEKVSAMFSIETIGYYSDKQNSQKYPFPFGLFYPNAGNFIGFVGNISSRALVLKTLKTFRETTHFPSEGGSIPSWVPGVAWSDHWAFWKQGYPAIMITDTAPYRYPFYHTSDDTPDKIYFDHMTKVVMGLEKVINEIIS
ncbi:MAG: M28 family peptidase [Candidatus Berkiellales bacterium]